MSDEVILLADDDELSREFLAEAFRLLGVKVTEAADGVEAIEAMRATPFDYVITDLQMPNTDGLGVLRESKALEPDRPVILVTAHGTMGVAIDALRRGADDILEKPVAVEDLELALARVRERARLRRENRFLRARAVGGDMLVESLAMRSVLETIARVACSPVTVLIQGESGTGKERVAAQVHRLSDRAERGAYVKVNCAAIPDGLMESEFFGHEVGAFTGATKRRAGSFELADGGTLFLDEVGELPLSLQAKLLRALQEGEFSRVGGSQPLRVDVRVVAATNRDLAADVQAGRFREDLYYRLNVVPVIVPPLRERRDEILPLARMFSGRGVQLSSAAEQLLVEHEWRGNVRELQNVVQRASLLCVGGIVEADLIAPWLDGGGAADLLPRPDGSADEQGLRAGQTLRAVEDQLIRVTLDACGGNRTRAAKLLGIGVPDVVQQSQVARVRAQRRLDPAAVSFMPFVRQNKQSTVPHLRGRRRAPRPQGFLSGPRSSLRRFGSSALARMNEVLDRLPPGRWMHQAAQRSLHFSQVDVEFRRGEAGLDGLRIAFLSDLHLGSYMNVDDMCRVFERVAEQEPDLVCFGGDLINTRERELLMLRKPLDLIDPPLGMFAVPGNHDHFFGLDLGLWESFLQDHGVNVLLNRGARIERDGASMWIAGVDDLTEGEPDLARAMIGSDPDEPVLVLAHHPDFFVESADAKVDLQLSGHTHGGQIVLFGWTPLKHSVHGYWRGLFRREQSQLYVSRGVGVTLLPLRIGASAEIPMVHVSVKASIENATSAVDSVEAPPFASDVPAPAKPLST